MAESHMKRGPLQEEQHQEKTPKHALLLQHQTLVQAGKCTVVKSNLKAILLGLAQTQCPFITSITKGKLARSWRVIEMVL